MVWVHVSETSSWPLLLMLSVGPVNVPAPPPAIHRLRWCLSGFGCLCWSLRWYNWWSGPLLWLGLDRLSGLCDGQRWTLGHWCGGRVCGWTWHLCGGNTCCVYQIYASIYVWLGGSVIDGVGPHFSNVQLAVDTDAFNGTWQGTVVSIWQYIADVDACLRFVACVGHYDGIIDGLTRCCDWVWTACLVFCDGQWWTLGHWCGCRVCGWTRHLRGGNTCCVYQIYASIYICLCGCVTDGVGPRFGNVQLAVATNAGSVGPVSMYLLPPPWQYIADVDACLGLVARVGHATMV